MIIHYDLFAGIGGFSLVLDRVYGKENTKHIFVENDPFCTAVLRKHWSEGEFWGDIREFVAYAQKQRLEREVNKEYGTPEYTILTGGVPCQPVSQAGRRKGTEDDRWLWPEALRCLSLIKPDIAVFENPTGLITYKQGVVFKNLLFQMEAEGYSVQCFIIPACAVGAPTITNEEVFPFGHRRITASWQLPDAYRGLARPSSANTSKASTDCFNSNRPKYLAIKIGILFTCQRAP